MPREFLSVECPSEWMKEPIVFCESIVTFTKVFYFNAFKFIKFSGANGQAKFQASSVIYSHPYHIIKLKNKLRRVS
uniref:Uncharacterized protein n=2 Tax=Rhizophora mucronata TaxID=61149 RepID=A0A2P2JBA1_RHIMU